MSDRSSPAGEAPKPGAAPAGGPLDFVPRSLFRKLAHDIVGNAGVTRGALAEVERSLGESPSETQVQLLKMARRGLARVERLARRLRWTGLAETSELKPSVAALNLRDVLSKALAEATELDGRKTVSVESIVPPEPIAVRVDEELLVGALAEIVGNAQRFARKSVKVTLRLSEGSPERAGSSAEIDVEDDGPGFKAEFAAQLLPRLREREGQRGSGLSLASVLAVLEQHDATFTIQPVAAGATGARVTVAIPTAEP